MRILFLLTLALCLNLLGTAYAQEMPLGKQEASDPQAKAILDDLRAKYEGYSALSLDFDLNIEFPEEQPVVQQGKLLRKGDAYRVDVAQQTVISDGESVWILLHKNKEVQINDVDLANESGMFSPQSLFNFYDGGDYLYALVNEIAQSGTVVQQIEFKPLDKTSEFFKLRLEIDKKKKQPMRLVAFGKDSSKYTLEIKSIEPNASIAASRFTFSEADYPDYYITDLRE